MKVYVITKGEYSGYHIVGVALDKEKAETLKKIHSDMWDEAEIEEYDTENFIIDHKPMYKVRFNSSGEVINCYEFNSNIDGFDDVEEHVYSHGSEVVLHADDEKSAIKIAAERRSKYLAKKNGL